MDTDAALLGSRPSLTPGGFGGVGNAGLLVGPPILVVMHSVNEPLPLHHQYTGPAMQRNAVSTGRAPSHKNSHQKVA